MKKLYYYKISNENITPVHFPALERHRRIILLLSSLGVEVLIWTLYR